MVASKYNKPVKCSVLNLSFKTRMIMHSLAYGNSNFLLTHWQHLWYRACCQGRPGRQPHTHCSQPHQQEGSWGVKQSSYMTIHSSWTQNSCMILFSSYSRWESLHLQTIQYRLCLVNWSQYCFTRPFLPPALQTQRLKWRPRYEASYLNPPHCLLSLILKSSLPSLSNLPMRTM